MKKERGRHREEGKGRGEGEREMKEGNGGRERRGKERRGERDKEVRNEAMERYGGPTNSPHPPDTHKRRLCKLLCLPEEVQILRGGKPLQFGLVSLHVVGADEEAVELRDASQLRGRETSGGWRRECLDTHTHT